jgi:predicted DNA-binding protein (MmcQ/YjbR family)
LRHHDLVNPADLRDLCLTFRGSSESFPFGFETSVFKVAGKIFALSQLDGDPFRVSLKCEPLLAQELRALHPAIIAGYHLNKRHWNTVTLDGSVPDQMIEEMVEDSYDLVVCGLPRARRRGLLWSGEQH